AAATDDASRRVAAREVLRQFGADTALAVPRQWLAEEPAASLRLVSGAAEAQTETEALAAALVRTLRTGENGESTWMLAGVTPDARAACLGIFSRSLEPVSCEALVAWLAASGNGQRQPVVQALVAMTGREDLGASHASWRQWLDRHKHLPPLAWRTLLAEGVQKRAERLAQRERELLNRLGDSTRRLYAALPPAERPAVLAAMLSDAEPTVRLTATDLLSRDLERGVSPTPEVSAALVSLLEDPQANIRQAAAVLVDRIVPEGSAAKLTVALRKETEPEVAAVMLRAYRRFPDAAAIDAVLRWLEHGEPTRAVAMRAVLSLLESGFTPSDDQAQRILATIDTTMVPGQPSTMPPSAVPVLVRLGGADGVATVRSLLYADRAELRRAAADVLVLMPEAIDDLLVAAEADPALLQRAADAVAMHKPWAPLLRRIATLELRTPTDASAADILPVTAGLARLMSPQERLAAAQELTRRPFAVRAILGRPTREMFAEGAAGDKDYAKARSLLGLPEPTPDPAPSEPAAEIAAESTPVEEPAPADPGG
ncbi:MAG: hypothetical protein ACIAQU_07230, partial [Phycisphaerales bacterium JB064]